MRMLSLPSLSDISPQTSMWSSGSALITSRRSSVRRPYSTLREPRSYSKLPQVLPSKTSVEASWVFVLSRRLPALSLRPTQVKWKLMVASCYRRSGENESDLELLTQYFDRMSLPVLFHPYYGALSTEYSPHSGSSPVRSVKIKTTVTLH